MKKQEKKEKPSKYKFAMGEKSGRPAIIDKETGEEVETFSMNCDEGLIVQRLLELREDEVWRNKILSGTSMDGQVVKGGIIV